MIVDNEYEDKRISFTHLERMAVSKLLVDEIKSIRHKHNSVLQGIFLHYNEAAQKLYKLKTVHNLFGLVTINPKSMDELREIVRDDYRKLNTLSFNWQENIRLLKKIDSRQAEHFINSSFDQLHKDDYLWEEFENFYTLNVNSKKKITGNIKQQFLKEFGDYR